jgi:hypothetical protein
MFRKPMKKINKQFLFSILNHWRQAAQKHFDAVWLPFSAQRTEHYEFMMWWLRRQPYGSSGSHTAPAQT